MSKYLKILLVTILFGCLCTGNFTTLAAINGGYPLTENREVYKQDDSDGEITHLYVTVLKKMGKKTKRVITFKDVNSYEPGKKKYDVDITIQEGTKAGPSNTYAGKGKIEVRGTTAADFVQKSYKIRLSKKTNSWKGLKIINLNKHTQDLTRVRNKLSFDLFRTIPNFTSFRTRFVVLHIKDMTAINPDYQFHDYGLFTMVEQVNKTFLRDHKLDPAGVAYKAENFEFYRYAEQLKNIKDPGYDIKKFEQILEVSESKDHTKLLRMLNDVNNMKLPIDEVVAEHFNLDNMMTWLSINILLGNTDANYQDFFLYSPSNASTWYFLPWDFDGAWGLDEQTGSTLSVPKWQKGVSNYWGMVLFNRMFREPKYIDALKDKMESVSKIITKQKIQSFLTKYYPIVSQMVRRNPDLVSLPAKVDLFDAEYRRIADVPEKNRQLFYKNLTSPMPFFIGDPELVEKKYVLGWDASYSLQGESLTYQFQLSSNPQFTNIVLQKDLKETEITMDKLAKGTYYCRVIARDSKGNSQIAFDTFVDDRGKSYFGVKQVMIK